MYNFAKILKLIYREVDIARLLNEPSEKSFTKKQMKYKYMDSFQMDRKIYIDYLTSIYCKVYPDNYSKSEVEHLVTTLKKNMDNVITFGERKEKNYNTINLFILIVNHYLVNTVSTTVVSFDELNAWEDIINTIDVNILIAIQRARNNSKMIEETSIVKHNNNRIYKKLENGYGDNHMHFNASGYNVEINWFNYFARSYKNKTKVFHNETSLFNAYITSKSVSANEKGIIYKKIKYIRCYLYYKTKANKCYQRYPSSRKIMKVGTDFSKFDRIDLKNVLDTVSEHKLLQYAESMNYVEMLMNDEINKYQVHEYKYVLFERDYLTSIFELYFMNKLNCIEVFALNTYLSAMCQFKFNFIQDKVGMGFKKFKELQDHKKDFISDEDLIIKSVFDKYYREGSIKFIEIRIAPKTKADLIQFINKVDKINNEVFMRIKEKNEKLEKIKYGIIIHYIKNNAGFYLKSNKSRKPHFADMLNRASIGLTKYLEAQKNIIEFNEKFLHNGRMVNQNEKFRVIGIDAASSEYNCPPEYFGPVFRKHKYKDAYCKLGITYHVGEDYINLANGLRVVDEAIIFLGMSRGDRIGHAISLGTNVFEYYKRKNGRLLSTLQNHLDDLAWSYFNLKDDSMIDRNVVDYLREEAEKYLTLLYKGCKKPELRSYINSMFLRGDDPQLYRDLGKNMNEKDYLKFHRYNGEKVNFREEYHKEAFLDDAARRCYLDYHYKEKVKRNGSYELDLEISDEYCKALEKMQEKIKFIIYNKGISIEVNPSSNLKISSARDLGEIQLISLNDFNLKKENYTNNSFNVPVSINTDDSAVFQTNLSNEYSIVASYLINAGFEAETVYDYIEYLRKLSYEVSFIETV